MRKILLVLLIIVPIVIFGILISQNKNTNPQKSSAQAVPTTAPNQKTQIGQFSFAWFMANTNTLKLIPNFSEKFTSRDVANENHCTSLANASYYSKDNKPLGLFVSNWQTLANFEVSSLLDGVLSINDMATPRITRETPQDRLQIALQTGPMIKENASFINLTIQNDKDSRRVLAGVSGENKLYFLTIYNPSSEFSGPLLSQVPQLLQEFEKQTNLVFADAINLDGGTASAFYNSNLRLSEFTNVGAFFCQP